MQHPTPHGFIRRQQLFVSRVNTLRSVAMRRFYTTWTSLAYLRRFNVVYREDLWQLLHLYQYGVYQDVARYNLFRSFISTEHRYTIARHYMPKDREFSVSGFCNITQEDNSWSKSAPIHILRESLGICNKMLPRFGVMRDMFRFSNNCSAITDNNLRYLYTYSQLRVFRRLYNHYKFNMFAFYRNYILGHARMYNAIHGIGLRRGLANL